MGLDERAVKAEIRDPNPDAATDPSIGGESSSLVVTLHLYGRLFAKGIFMGVPAIMNFDFCGIEEDHRARGSFGANTKMASAAASWACAPTASVIVSHEAEAEFFTHLDREIKMATNNAVPEDQSAELSA
jgi:hypothetical protein